MAITPVALLRGICLAFGVAALLVGTVLFPIAQRMLHGWLQMAQRLAGPEASTPPARVTHVLENPIVLRAWQFVCAAIGLGLWWYLGTAHGAAFVAATLRPH